MAQSKSHRCKTVLFLIEVLVHVKRAFKGAVQGVAPLFKGWVGTVRSGFLSTVGNVPRILGVAANWASNTQMRCFE